MYAALPRADYYGGSAPRRSSPRACCTTTADVRPVLVKRNRFRLPRIHLRSATLDLGIPGLGHTGLRLSIETPRQLKRQLGAILCWKAKDVSEDIRGGHGLSVAS
jgi:hypothetical protein